jgi:hypothetical protein
MFHSSPRCASEVDGPIGRMTLTQGDKLNPLGTVPLREIAEAAQWFNSTLGAHRDRHRRGSGVLVGLRPAGVRRRRAVTIPPLCRVATRPTSAGSWPKRWTGCPH